MYFDSTQIQNNNAKIIYGFLYILFVLFIFIVGILCALYVYIFFLHIKKYVLHIFNYFLYDLMFILRKEHYNGAMEMSDLFNLLHNAVEAQRNGKKISQKEMAQELGISMRTYQDWRLGNAKPQAAKAVIEMLGMLDDDEIIRVVRKINKLGEKS